MGINRGELEDLARGIMMIAIICAMLCLIVRNEKMLTELDRIAGAHVEKKEKLSKSPNLVFLPVPVGGRTTHVRYASVVAGKPINVTSACGGYLMVTSTCATTVKFLPPLPPKQHDGSLSDGCVVVVINGNLVPGRTLTIRSSGLMTTDWNDIKLGSGGSFQIVSYPAANIWVQTSEATKSE